MINDKLYKRLQALKSRLVAQDSEVPEFKIAQKIYRKILAENNLTDADIVETEKQASGFLQLVWDVENSQNFAFAFGNIYNVRFVADAVRVVLIGQDLAELTECLEHIKRAWLQASDMLPRVKVLYKKAKSFEAYMHGFSAGYVTALQNKQNEQKENEQKENEQNEAQAIAIINKAMSELSKSIAILNGQNPQSQSQQNTETRPKTKDEQEKEQNDMILYAIGYAHGLQGLKKLLQN